MASTQPASIASAPAGSAPDRPCRRDDVALQEVGGEAILVDQRLGQAHVINGPAAMAWRLCDGQHDIDSLAVAFGAPFGLEGTVVHDDLVALVDGFRSLGLLEPEGQGGDAQG